MHRPLNVKWVMRVSILNKKTKKFGRNINRRSLNVICSNLLRACNFYLLLSFPCFKKILFHDAVLCMSYSPKTTCVSITSKNIRSVFCFRVITVSIMQEKMCSMISSTEFSPSACGICNWPITLLFFTDQVAEGGNLCPRIDWSKIVLRLPCSYQPSGNGPRRLPSHVHYHFHSNRPYFVTNSYAQTNFL